MIYHDMNKSNVPLIECINIIKGTVNNLTDLQEVSSITELIVYLENLYPDSTFFMDQNIESLFDYLYDGGYNDYTIIEMNKSLYGHFIEFSYYKDLDIYIMEYGIR